MEWGRVGSSSQFQLRPLWGGGVGRCHGGIIDLAFESTKPPPLPAQPPGPRPAPPPTHTRSPTPTTTSCGCWSASARSSAPARTPTPARMRPCTRSRCPRWVGVGGARSGGGVGWFGGWRGGTSSGWTHCIQDPEPVEGGVEGRGGGPGWCVWRRGRGEGWRARGRACLMERWGLKGGA